MMMITMVIMMKMMMMIFSGYGLEVMLTVILDDGDDGDFYDMGWTGTRNNNR